MLDSETNALLRAVLHEVCVEIGRYENGIRAHVASKLLEAARDGRQTVEELKERGRQALKTAPAMWRYRSQHRVG